MHSFPGQHFCVVSGSVVSQDAESSSRVWKKRVNMSASFLFVCVALSKLVGEDAVMCGKRRKVFVMLLHKEDTANSSADSVHTEVRSRNSSTEYDAYMAFRALETVKISMCV